ncbi:MAG: DUF503 domain-containing protein [Synergistaceae bacterium]|jgi:uncharacterized protein YlxP (DUF503 family)|nr:DUF503 domain-containing protein [Synergistaceae bacterium]
MKPWIGIVMFRLKIYVASSLKDRRQVVRSLTERLKKRFNVSVADLGPDGLWNVVDMAISCVGSSHQEMESRIDQIFAFVENDEENGEFEILNTSREVLSYGHLQDRTSQP